MRVPDAAPDSAVAAERLAAERGVVSLPGGVFGPGGERHIRLAFANTDEDTIAAVPGRLAGLFARESAPARDERMPALPGAAAAPGRSLDRSA
jgi:aspartate/methionine/tyrosine aminotransferase